MPIARTTPKIIERKCGGFLAVSTEGSRFKIGVEGKTEDEARQRFEESVTMWERIAATEEPQPRYDA